MSGNLTINSLVPPTWNRLKVNDCELTLPDTFTQGTASNAFETAGAGLSDGSFEMLCGCGDVLSDALKERGILPKQVLVTGTETVKSEISYKGDAADIICIKAEEGQTINILTDIASSDNKATGVLQLRITAAKGSVINLSQLVRAGKDFTFVDDIGISLEEGARINLSQVFAGGGKIISGYRAGLSGEDSFSNVHVGLVRKESQLIDMNYVMKHTAPVTKSETYVSGTLMEGGSKTFRGTIDFVKGCVGAEGAENENMLLLDDTVINKTVPLILCDEENVAGSHGASIGRPAEDMLYYMMSRGITRERALKILEKASLDSAVAHIEDENTREYVSAAINDIFGEE